MTLVDIIAACKQCRYCKLRRYVWYSVFVRKHTTVQGKKDVAIVATGICNHEVVSLFMH